MAKKDIEIQPGFESWSSELRSDAYLSGRISKCSKVAGNLAKIVNH